MPRSAARLLLFALSLLLLAGCWNRRELEENAFVLALGIDRGERMEYAVTAAIAIPALIAGKEIQPAGGGEKQPLVVTTVEAATVAIGLQMLDQLVDRRLTLRHTKVLFVGEETARANLLLPMRELIRFWEARRTMFLVVTKGKAAAFLEKMDVRLERDPHRYVEQLATAFQYTGFLPAAAHLHDVVKKLQLHRGEPLAYYAAIREQEEEEDWTRTARPGDIEFGGAYVSGEIPRKGGPNIDMMGAAVIKGSRMIGLLTGQQTRWTLIFQNRFRRGMFTVPDPLEPDRYVTLDVRTARSPRFDIRVENGRVRADILFRMEGEVIALGGATDYTLPDRQLLLERKAAQTMKAQVERLVAKAQQELEADVFFLGDHVARLFPTVQSWEGFRWVERFPDATINVDVELTLRRFGTEQAPPRE
jgi:spore germination protein KC